MVSGETRAVLRLTPECIRPHGALVLTRMQVPAGAALSDRLRALLDEAADTFAREAAPVAVFDELPVGEFEQLYEGAGRNQPHTPVPVVARRAEALALFAGTLGPAMDAAIARAFGQGNAALGCVLDTYASIAAERLAERAADRFRECVDRRHPDGRFVLPYSPGYCGWHVSGQRALFERLRPGEIGIVLNASCMMVPVKSVSGVLIAGSREAHRFSPSFPFCEACTHRECLDRMRALRNVS